ncbi:MAG TPA: SH3 domain-containing protein [Chloroflexi bacterium]|jgi:hypothetical protein|nr:SH3 domain-containing protein [Chloroflexota bacterium]
MSFEPNKPSRSRSNQDLWPKWMWVAVPVLVVVVVAGLWWAIFAPSDAPGADATMTPTLRVIDSQPTPEATPEGEVGDVTPTRQALPPLPTFTATPPGVTTPTAPAEQGEEEPASAPDLAIGSTAVVSSGGSGLNMRAGAGTGHARVKTLTDGSTVEIIGGPQDANDYTWWQVRDEAGTTGWVVVEYLTTP